MIPDFFSPAGRAWFDACFAAPTAVELEGWRAIRTGKDVLVSAPTGTGKTLTAFFGFIDELGRETGEVPETVEVVYISPLKSLGNDIRENLRRPIDGMGLAERVTVGVRTGDTTPYERQKMLRHPPRILITTPESLYLLLTTARGRRMLATTRAAIVDEFHTLASVKRGIHLLLSLARLDACAGRHVQRIALSATIQPLALAAQLLSGARPAVIVAPEIKKAADVRVISPLPDMRVLPEKSIWPVLGRVAHAEAENARTTIAFVDGRAMCERLAHAVNESAEDDFARTHHGCISKEKRLEAETLFRTGKLRLLCATSSMELGIDVGDVDATLQIGLPGSVAGTLQRLGRAGHGPGRVSRMRIYPRTAAETFPCAMMAQAALEGRLEPLQPPQMCLDVLAQHLVSMAAEDAYTPEEVLELFRQEYPYRELTMETLTEVLKMLAGDAEHAADKPVRARLVFDRIHGRVSGDEYTKMLALSSPGTIPDRGWFQVTLADGTHLGELDEEFVFEARLGDKFLLGAFAWKIQEITSDRVIVVPSSVEGAQSPFWRGDGVGRAYETACRFGAIQRAAGEAAREGRLLPFLRALPMDENAAQNAARSLTAQLTAAGELPNDRLIYLEHMEMADNDNMLMVHSIFGRRVNRALSLLLQWTAAQATGVEVRAFEDDDGIMLYALGNSPLPDGLIQALAPDKCAAAIAALLPQTAMFSMAFRYAAQRALMMGMKSGRRQALWVQRLRGAESLSLALREADHPLIAETKRECLEDILDIPALQAVLTDVRAGRIRVLERHVDVPSPMSLPMRRQVEAEEMYDYSPVPRAAVLRAEADMALVQPVPEAFSSSGDGKAAASAEEVHAVLMMQGDYAADDAQALPGEILEALAAEGRAVYVEPGLWIAAEQADEYQAALTGDAAACAAILRRCIRYHGAQDADSLAQRYCIAPDEVEQVLGALVAQGSIVAYEGAYVHADVYKMAQRATIAIRRNEIVTAEAHAYAAYLARGVTVPGNAREQLAQVLSRYEGFALPAEWWEEVVFPARVNSYRPELLDGVLARGEFSYRYLPETGQVMFLSGARMLSDEIPSVETLPPEERQVLQFLERRGASFASAIATCVPGGNVGAALDALLCRGLIASDSFSPVRLLKDHGKGGDVIKKSVRLRVKKQDAGRWFIAGQPMENAPADEIARRFAWYGILCRESARGMNWPDALSVLRVMEYTGKARRGYFVRGLSGAQFVRAEDFGQIRYGLQAEGASYEVLNAVDPALAWGSVLPHCPQAPFKRVPGCVVVLYGGAVCLIVERGGAQMTVLEADRAADAIAAFAHAFRVGRVYAGRRRLSVTAYDRSLAPALEKAGFIREMLDYVLMK